MALELIGARFGAKVLDIHTGGVDLIFPHHEDEIAQSCAFTGEPEFARVWMHAEFLNVRGTKMSKRFGNITTPRDLKQDGVDPGAIRLLVYQTHYRQRLDLTDEALAAAREGSRRLGEFARRFHAAAASADGAGFAGAAERLTRDFTTALNDDLNAPRALAALFDFVTEGNRLLDQGEKPGPRRSRHGNWPTGCSMRPPSRESWKYEPALTPMWTTFPPTRPNFLPPRRNGPRLGPAPARGKEAARFPGGRSDPGPAGGARF